MPALTNILVATHFGEPADLATEYALALAHDVGARVTLLHAYHIPVYSYADGAMGATEDVAAGLSASADNAMSCVLEKHRARGVPLKAAIRVSSAAEEVQRFAEEIHADLIVVGTHVRRGLARALLGSVAEGIVRTATRPVVVVPSPTTR